MIRVQQKQTCGCTIAAVAMIVGKTYDEVAAESTRDFDTDGVCIEDWYDYLFMFSNNDSGTCRSDVR